MTFASTKAYISLGSNLGDRIHYLREAAKQIDALPRLHVSQKSSLYSNAALIRPDGTQDDPMFINAVIEVTGQFQALELLGDLQRIEKKLGRIRSTQWAPRTIDLDLLTIGSLVLSSPELTIPHPEIENRDFILLPLTEIAHEWRHPVLQLSARQLLDQLMKGNQNTREMPKIIGNL